ncbi:hypothetical protein ACO0LG_25995 [Undibacterium sp. Ji42W]|uniref:hypothetical protein n=1 Tax=Undibacterium sp. Ji42W TaxID=3413039 RepID=UPI003BF23316
MRQQKGHGDEFKYCLNAFVFAARSISFLLQKEMAHVCGFKQWWACQQESLSHDRYARFFLKLRNYSQKEGQISTVGIKTGNRWSFRFAGNIDAVPEELLHRDVADCCVEHLSKLAKIVLACAEKFLFHVCPKQAISIEGGQTLQISVADIAETLCFEASWIAAAKRDIPLDVQLRLLGGVYRWGKFCKDKKALTQKDNVSFHGGRHRYPLDRGALKKLCHSIGRTSEIQIVAF